MQVLPFLTRMLYKLQSLVFTGWLRFVELQKEERQAARRAISFWVGGLTLKVLLAFHSYAQRRITRRQRNELAAWTAHSSRGLKHLRAWHAAWDHKHTERLLLTKSVAFLTRSGECKALAAWREKAMEAAIQRAQLGAAHGRWRNQELAQALHKLIEQLEAEREAQAKGRRVLARLMNRSLTKGWLAWSAMAEERMHKLAKMAAVAQTVMHRGKRAAFNTLIELHEHALELRRISALLRLKEARAVLGAWYTLGRQHRLMISTMRRLACRELTRGWMAWRGEYVATLDKESAAHRKALAFGGRLLHMEAARGFHALLEQYQRVLELRVILRRVANPRALGMLRRWQRLATERAVQMRKLRRAYSMLANGSLTRITLAWRGLVVQRQQVKQRVARLLGKMLDATFHAWLRVVRKRLACKQAALEVAQRRRERVWADFLRIWVFHAHLSSGLAQGLRQLFVRNTSVIFRMWHEWAHEEADDRAALEALQGALQIPYRGRTLQEAEGLLTWSGLRWRCFEEAAAFGAWTEMAQFRVKASMLTGLAIAHSAQALGRWAFDEYRFAVRVQIEERAAGLFWSTGIVRSVMLFWRALAQTGKIMQSKHSKALHYFLSRLEQLVLVRWRDACREWKNERLGMLASRLHFEGTLTLRVFLGWRNYAHLNAFRERQVKVGIARHFLSLGQLTFSAWRSLTRALLKAKAFCDDKYEASVQQQMSYVLHKWSAEARDLAILSAAVGGNSRRVLLREGVRAWHAFAELSALFSGHFESSAAHAEYCLKRTAWLRWRELSAMLGTVALLTNDLVGGKATAAKRGALNAWCALARGASRLSRSMQHALEAWGGAALETGFGRWRLASIHGTAKYTALRKAAAAFLSKTWFGCFQRWAGLARRRADQQRKAKRSLGFWSRGLESRVLRAWAKVLSLRSRRDEIVAKFIGKLLHRNVALCMGAWMELVEARRQLRATASAMATRVANKELTGALMEWKCVWQMACFESKLSTRVLEHLHDLAAKLLSVRFAEWATEARIGAIMRILLGKTGRRDLASGFYTLWRYRCEVHFERLRTINRSFYVEVAFKQIEQTTRLERLLEVLTGTNVERDLQRRLRRWHYWTAKVSALELRQRYLAARRQFLRRHEILTHWRMSAAASQHARKASLSHGLFELRKHARQHSHLYRCTVRALGLWRTTLAHRIVHAWRLHTETARYARLEIIRARANQTALDAHRRRARARALSAIVTSWRVYAHSRASVRLLADAAASASRRRTAFDRWHLTSAMATRTFAAQGMANLHFGGTARRVLFEHWRKLARLRARHGALFEQLSARFASATTWRVLSAWRGLVVRSHRLGAILLAVTGRLLELTMVAWKRFTRTVVEQDLAADEMGEIVWKQRLRLALRQWQVREAQLAQRRELVLERVARLLRGASAVAIYQWNKYARRQMTGQMVALRMRSSKLYSALTSWRQQLLHAKRQLHTAAAHAFAGRKYSTLSRWKRFHSYRRARRERLEREASSRLTGKCQRTCGEVVRMWRALSVCSRRERRDAAVALDMLRAAAASASGRQLRLASAFGYYCKRLAGLVFFHWRALSWSRNWEKPGRFTEDGFDVAALQAAERIGNSPAESSLQSRHARMAAHLVRGAVVHQRRSALSFQQAAPPPSSPRFTPRFTPAPGGLPTPGRKGSSPGSPSGGGAHSPPRSYRRSSPSAVPRALAHALSPTGLSVALVLGSQMLEAAPPDEDLELSEPYGAERLGRDAPITAPRLARGAAGSAGAVMGASQRRVPITAARGAGREEDREEDDEGEAPRRTPATLYTPAAGSPRRTLPEPAAGFQTLEQFARQERLRRGGGA